MAFAAVEAGSSGGGLDRAEIGERKPAEALHSAWWRGRWRERRFRLLARRLAIRARVIGVSAKGSQDQLLPLEQLLRFDEELRDEWDSRERERERAKRERSIACRAELARVAAGETRTVMSSRVAARTQLRCLSGSHSDFETVRKKVPATAEGVQAMIKEQARRGVATRGLRM